MKFIKTSGLHASELVKGILNYATTSIDKKQFTSIDLKSILDMVTFQLKNIIQEKNAIISYKALPEIKGDKLLIYQLFQNLISNAINYCYDGRPPEIMITSDTHTDNIVLMVKDNGKGIPHDNITSIFKPLVRLEKDIEGTGMGLSIAQKIIDIHEGKIWVESEVGIGSTFYISFPK